MTLEGLRWCRCSLSEGLRDWKESRVLEAKAPSVDFHLVACTQKKKKLLSDAVKPGEARVDGKKMIKDCLQEDEMSQVAYFWWNLTR